MFCYKMWKCYLLMLLYLFSTAMTKKELIRDNLEDISLEESDARVHYKKNMPTTISRSAKSDAIVEKFVETLISSERYLKMVEIIERKLTLLDATFHERTNSILKYLTEILKLGKPSQADALENTLVTVRNDLDKVKQFLAEHLEKLHIIVDGSEFHGNTAIDLRLSVLENNIKKIVTGVESVVSTISQVKNRQTSRTCSRSESGGVIDTISLINEFRRTLHEQKMKKCECKSGRVDRSERYPTDCHEIHMQGFNVSGIYKVKPDDMEPFYVLCDLTTAGGGWTVFQNRFDGSQDFFKGWTDYKHGFGNLAGEFWLGLEKINYLTNQKLYELRIEMETQHGQDAYAGYSVFTVGPEHEAYRISTLGSYYGTAGDSLSYHAGQKFSTLDIDNDEWKDGSCAMEHGGAWWYKECDKSNLNGKYSMSADEHRGQSVYWISFKDPNSPLTKSKMMIRPLPTSKPINFNESNRVM
ncbi:fibrinogen C domain-containing protein 1-like isoform X1 [Galleria mellonella]|uniref:Fibrinogen C domain-containing protein 1-like isoform X1 n=1 Tax=Galleria mellonella TaxID=7137 RepID=A0A6J3C150_GALME|nr:fibrinogen C domain-containing protein 1-like isoform X1 [Galleria mellonella]